MAKETSCYSDQTSACGLNEVKSVVSTIRKHFKDSFFNPTIGSFLEAEVPGKRVLDIGCGPGRWCYEAAQYGAKSIDGFDKQERMVELAKQATSQFHTVNIQLGDVMNMPYDDNTFDIALSIFVTCELPIDTLSKHFKEIHRVLVPGGKALVLNLSKPAFQSLITDGANEAVVQEKIDQILSGIPDHPTLQQISKAFESLREVAHINFAYNKNGSLFLVKDADQSLNGQAIVRKNFVSTFTDFYYDDQFLVDQTIAAGLQIDSIENSFTEQRQSLYNALNPELPLRKTVLDHPFLLLYRISKPT